MTVVWSGSRKSPPPDIASAFLSFPSFSSPSQETRYKIACSPPTVELWYSPRLVSPISVQLALAIKFATVYCISRFHCTLQENERERAAVSSSSCSISNACIQPSLFFFMGQSEYCRKVEEGGGGGWTPNEKMEIMQRVFPYYTFPDMVHGQAST